VHARGSHGHRTGRPRRPDRDRAPAGQRPAAGAVGGSPDSGRGGLPLVRRRLAVRGRGPDRPGPSLRAPDVPGLGPGPRERPLRAGPGRGRLAQRHDELRVDQLLRDHARPPAGARALAGGRPDGLPAGRARRRVDGEPARRRQERAPAALRQRALRHGVRADDRAGLSGGPSVPPHADRLDGGPGRGDPGGRAGVLPDQLRPQQRGPGRGWRHRPGPGPGLGAEVLRLHPVPRRQGARPRRDPARHHRHRTARSGKRCRPRP
jgi:hypothetical protein